MAYNFNCLFENGGLLNVMGTHVHCKCSNNLNTVQDANIVTADH